MSHATNGVDAELSSGNAFDAIPINQVSGNDSPLESSPFDVSSILIAPSPSSTWLRLSAMNEAEFQTNKRLTSRIVSSSSRLENSLIKSFLDVDHETLEAFPIDGSSHLQFHLPNASEVLDFMRDRLPPNQEFYTKEYFTSPTYGFVTLMNVANIYECDMIPVEMAEELDLNELNKAERNISVHVFFAYLLGLSSEQTYKVIDPPPQIVVLERTPRMPQSDFKQPNDVTIGQLMPGHPQVIFSNNLQPIAPVDQTDRGALAYAKPAQYFNNSDAENASTNPMDMTESNIARPTIPDSNSTRSMTMFERATGLHFTSRTACLKVMSHSQSIIFFATARTAVAN